MIHGVKRLPPLHEARVTLADGRDLSVGDVGMNVMREHRRRCEREEKAR